MAAQGPAAPPPRAPEEATPAETPQESPQTQGSVAAEEFVLRRAFATCDAEHTGTVSVQAVVEYLQELAGQSGEEGRLRALHRMLDPAAAGAALDLPTFHAVAREWMAVRRQEGTEAAGLRSRAEQLATRNAKLQRDAEVAEELNTRLAEETAQLKAQLRSTQQALEQARGAAEELEDAKAVVEELQEQNGELRRQAHQLEKEQRCLRSRADGLQEENQRLLTEGGGMRERIQVLAAETADLEAQLCRCTLLLSSRDAALAQAEQRVEELTATLEEYDRVVQELRLEKTQLREELHRVQDAGAAWPWCPLGETDIAAQPLSAEIEATCREMVEAEEEEEDAVTVAPGAPAEDGEELAELRQRPGASERLPRALVALPWPRALVALLLLLALVLLVALVALLCLLPCRWLGPPHSRAWPQLQLRYRGPPPL